MGLGYWAVYSYRLIYLVVRSKSFKEKEVSKYTHEHSGGFCNVCIKEKPCPKCKGKKSMTLLGGHSWKALCETCNGTGTQPSEVITRWEKGKEPTYSFDGGETFQPKEAKHTQDCLARKVFGKPCSCEEAKPDYELKVDVAKSISALCEICGLNHMHEAAKEVFGEATALSDRCPVGHLDCSGTTWGHIPDHLCEHDKYWYDCPTCLTKPSDHQDRVCHEKGHKGCETWRDGFIHHPEPAETPNPKPLDNVSSSSRIPEEELRDKTFNNKHGSFAEGTIVTFRVENEDMWGGDTRGVLINIDGEWLIDTEHSGRITIDRGYDAYWNSIQAWPKVRSHDDLPTSSGNTTDKKE